MSTIQTVVVTIISSILASSGVWSVLLFLLQKRAEKAGKNTAERKMLLALAHDRIYQICEYMLRDEVDIDIDDFDNLRILYEAYAGLGGNGTGKILYDKVCDKLKKQKRIKKEDADNEH